MSDAASIKPNGSAGEAPTPVGVKATIDKFDPDNWKGMGVSLDPTHPPEPAVLKGRVEVRKPPVDYYVSVHPSAEFNRVLPMYFNSEEKREVPYLIASDLELPPQVSANIVPTRLALSVTDVGTFFLWPVKLTGSSWHAEGEALLLRCMNGWLKIKSNKGGYDAIEPAAKIPLPTWPEGTLFKDFLFSAFRDHLVESLDHPVMRRLMGIR